MSDRGVAKPEDLRPSRANAFFFWGGDPDARLDQISISLHSFAQHNPDSRLYLITNEIDYPQLRPEIRDCPVTIVRWSAPTLVESTPFCRRAGELGLSHLRSRGAATNPWVVLSDFLRYLALWRWGGSYVDLDDVAVRPLPAGRNIVGASPPGSDPPEEHNGRLTGHGGPHDGRFSKLIADPLLRFDPRHPFLESCLETAFRWPPDLAGARVMSDVYGRTGGRPDVTLVPGIHTLLHPEPALALEISNRCGLGERWWWQQITRDEFEQRWERLLRAGRFPFVKNHGWRPLIQAASERLLSDWVCAVALERLRSRKRRLHDDIVSVVIPTHLQECLRDALEALCEQSDDRFEVIVVENGRRDENTERLVGQYAGPLDAHYVFEPRVGLNTARNVGCRRARGRVIAFLDDDCVPAPDWVGAVRHEFEADPALDVLAGRVSLQSSVGLPGWLIGDFRSLLSELEPKAGDTAAPSSDCVVGANFAVRRRVYELTGGFDEAVGMVGRAPPQLGNDEIEFCARAQELLGSRVQFKPNVLVWHQVAATRLRIEQFEQRRYGQAKSDIFLASRAEFDGHVAMLDILQRKLYDPTWLAALDDSSSNLTGSSRTEYLANSIRIRVEYLAGILEGYREHCPRSDVLDASIRRYERRAPRLAWRILLEHPDQYGALRRLAQFMIASAERMHGRRRFLVRPSTMAGRITLFHQVKREVVSCAELHLTPSRVS